MPVVYVRLLLYEFLLGRSVSCTISVYLGEGFGMVGSFVCAFVCKYMYIYIHTSICTGGSLEYFYTT